MMPLEMISRHKFPLIFEFGEISKSEIAEAINNLSSSPSYQVKSPALYLLSLKLICGGVWSNIHQNTCILSYSLLILMTCFKLPALVPGYAYPVLLIAWLHVGRGLCGEDYRQNCARIRMNPHDPHGYAWSLHGGRMLTACPKNVCIRVASCSRCHAASAKTANRNKLIFSGFSWTDD